MGEKICLFISTALRTSAIQTAKVCTMFTKSVKELKTTIKITKLFAPCIDKKSTVNIGHFNGTAQNNFKIKVSQQAKPQKST